jgi:hypothetical protein
MIRAVGLPRAAHAPAARARNNASGAARVLEESCDSR